MGINISPQRTIDRAFKQITIEMFFDLGLITLLLSDKGGIISDNGSG